MSLEDAGSQKLFFCSEGKQTHDLQLICFQISSFICPYLFSQNKYYLKGESPSKQAFKPKETINGWLSRLEGFITHNFFPETDLACAG